MKRGEIREQHRGFNAAPGFHFVPSGLRERRRKRNAESRSPTTAATFVAARAKSGRARLPAFHCGSRQRDSRPQGSASARLGGCGAQAAGCPAGTASVYSEAPRVPVIVPAGMMPKPPESAVTSLTPAGTALAPPSRGQRSGVLYVSERAALLRRAPAQSSRICVNRECFDSVTFLAARRTTGALPRRQSPRE